MTQYPKAPIGVFTYEDDVPGVESIELPDNVATKVARKAFELSEALDDQIPGAGDVWNWTKDKLGWLPGV